MMAKMQYFHFQPSEGQYGVKNVFIGQPAVVEFSSRIVRPVNIPLNDAETQNTASAKRIASYHWWSMEKPTIPSSF